MNKSINYTLNIISWNIQGLQTRLKPSKTILSNSKLNINSINRNLSNYDIILLQETWLKDQHLEYQGFCSFSSFRKSSNKRGHGGVSILIKNGIRDKVAHIKSQSPNIIWCKLNKSFFGLKTDIFIANVYLPPLQSQKKLNEDDLLILENEINKFSNIGHIILAGDFNSRTGILHDYIANDSVDFLDTINNVNYDTDKIFPGRNNSDLKTNKLGEGIIQLCISKKLRILNGRKTGDLAGKITSYQPQGVSTIDYGILSEDLWNDIIAFEVQPLTPYSDHCPIAIKLAISDKCINNINRVKKPKQNKNKRENNIRYVWQNNCEENFKVALRQDDIQGLMATFLSSTFYSADEEVHEFNKIVLETAKISLKKKQVSKKKNKKSNTWYDSECRYLKKKLQDTIKQLNCTHNSHSQTLRKDYFIIKKKYKKLVKKKHREYKNLIFDEIKRLDPKSKGLFWECLNNLRKTKKVTKNDITPDEWDTHFKSLLFDKSETPLENNAQSLDEDCDDSILNASFTEKEIQQHINKLKTKKAPGSDGILNEMIKHGRFYLVPLINKLFNDIMNSGSFPKQWNAGIIVPIYKNKGDANSPSNYRGITLASSLGKLFTSILKSRYMNFIEQNNKLNHEQFGFRCNSRTTDSLFIFQQLLYKYFGNKQKVYTCFIDYEKAFDTVWQKGLLFKLSKNGVKGKFYELIRTMHENIHSCVQVDQNTQTEMFHCNKGIMQGDSLSPVLFTTFMNDVPEYLKQNHCLGLSFYERTINCLMFADDLIIMSPTAEGLQKSMNTICSHARKWKLKINLKKSNVMIFRANGHYIPNHKFSLNNTNIEIVDKQTYLGLVFTPSGKFSYARTVLSNKAKKTVGHIRSLLSNCTTIPISLLLKLFDSLVKPVLLYGCEIWGPELLLYKTEFDRSAIEQTHLRFCKQILNIPFYSSNMKCRAELGRVPLSIDIKKQITRYYLRLRYNITNNILKEAFKYAISHPTHFNTVAMSMSKLQDHVSKETPLNKPNKQEIKSISEIMEKEQKNSFHQNYLKTLSHELNNKPTKFSYGNIKKEFSMEKYLDFIMKPSNRIIISKFRLNIHKLRINTGAYENSGQPIPTDQRICLFCNNHTIENEMHFILECQTFEKNRNAFIKEFSDKCSNFNNLSKKEKLCCILNVENKELANMVGKFLETIYKQRSQIKL